VRFASFAAKPPLPVCLTNFAIFDDDDQLAAVKLAMTRLNISDETSRRGMSLAKSATPKIMESPPPTFVRRPSVPTAAKSPTFSKAYEKLSRRVNALILTISSCAPQNSCVNLLPFANAGNNASIHSRGRISDTIAFNTIFFVSSPAETKTSALSATKTNPSTAGVAPMFPFSQLFSRFSRGAHHPSRPTIAPRKTFSTRAAAVVKNNPDRLGKTLKRIARRREPSLFRARDAQAEAEFVAGELQRILDDDFSLTCAVEYRTNFQSPLRRSLPPPRPSLTTCRRFSFYTAPKSRRTRLRCLAIHPEDDHSLLRVLNSLRVA